jgi:hypothetical protein
MLDYMAWWNADCFKNVPLGDVPSVLCAGEIAEALYWIHRGDFVGARHRWRIAVALYERILMASARR